VEGINSFVFFAPVFPCRLILNNRRVDSFSSNLYPCFVTLNEGSLQVVT